MKLLTSDEVIELVDSAGKDTEDVFEYLHGFGYKEDGQIKYDEKDVRRFIKR